MVVQGGDPSGEVSEGRLASEKTSILPLLLLAKLRQMKKVTLLVPDENMALVDNLVKAITGMEIVDIKDVGSIEEFQRKTPKERLDHALIVLVQEKGVIANKYDFAWLYAVVKEGYLKDIKIYSSVKSFRQYLKDIGIQNVPSNSTISDKYGCLKGKFPNWTFSDCDITESQRRINVAKRFLSLYHKGK